MKTECSFQSTELILTSLCSEKGKTVETSSNIHFMINFSLLDHFLLSLFAFVDFFCNIYTLLYIAPVKVCPNVIAPA